MPRSEPEFNKETLWLSRLVASRRPIGADNPVLSGILFPGSLVIVPYLVFLVLRWEELTLQVSFAYGMGAATLVAAPLTVWYFDERLLPRFFREAETVVPDPQRRSEAASRAYRFWQRSQWAMIVPFAPLAIGVYWTSMPFFVDLGGLHGLSDPFFIVWGLEYLWGAVLGSVGIVGIATMGVAVHGVTRHELELDPMHPDGVGGMNCIGRLAVGTTLLVSISSLLFPPLMLFGDYVGNPWLIWIALGIIVASILATFAFPTGYGYFRARAEQERRVAELRDRYVGRRDHAREALSPANPAGTTRPDAVGPAGDSGEANQAGQNPKPTAEADPPVDDAYLAHLEVLREEYDDTRQMSVFPLDPKVFAELLTSLAFPVLVFAIEATLSSFVF